MEKKLFAVLAALLIAGCAVKKEPVAVGGSRADGTIKMGYSYNLFESPVIDMDQAKALATERCKLWNYEEAVPFSGETTKCTFASGSCEVKTAFIEYQCIGGKGKE